MADVDEWALEQRERELEQAEREYNFRKCALLTNHDMESLRNVLTERIANRAYEDADYVMHLAQKYIQSWSDEEVITDLIETDTDLEI